MVVITGTVVAVVGIVSLLTGATGSYFLFRDTGNKHVSETNSKIDANGAINNVIVTDIQDRVEIESREILLVLYIMCAIKLIELIYFMYSRHVQNIKKRAINKNIRNQANQV